MSKQDQVKLHIGCGSAILPGWVNLDLREVPGVDIIDDATKLLSVKNGSCSMIYSCHVLEHISRHKIVETLTLWRSKLAEGGKLRLAVPDFEKVVSRYQSTKDIKECIGLVSGGQKNDHDYHFMIFDKASLTEYLIEAGFSNVSEWDWRIVDHSGIDDYSQAYLPHMDKENGMLMSLNLEATK